jgi:hypothetical protein
LYFAWRFAAARDLSTVANFTGLAHVGTGIVGMAMIAHHGGTGGERANSGRQSATHPVTGGA